ncbi:putative cobalamin synthesis protein, partial [Burkholderia sp. TJI49]
ASTTIAVPDVLDKARLRAWLKALPRTILRAKGIVRVADADGVALRVCQLAAGRTRFASIEDEGPTEPPGVMVFIGIIDASTDAMLRDGLAQCGTMAGSFETASNVD